MKQLNTKLSLLVLASLAATSAMTGVLVIRSQTAVLEEQLAYDSKALAKTLADMSIECVLGEDFRRLQDQITMVGVGNRQVGYVRVYDDAGKVRAFFPPSAEHASPQDPNLKVIQNPIVIALDDLPRETRGIVEVGLSNEHVAELTSTSLWGLTAGSLAGFPLLALVLWFFLRWNVIRPLSSLDAQVARISSGDLSQEIPSSSQDEIGRLAGGLERMRANLKESYGRIERQLEALKELDRMKDEFLANTSHELKTPLNGIIGLSESLLLGSYGALKKEQQESVDLIVSCANRLWKMTESLLSFSRLHRGAPGDESPPEEHYLVDHLEDALADLRASAEKQGSSLLVSIPRDFQCVYPQNELEQAVRILVDNAVKYAPAGIIQVLAEKWDSATQRGFQIGVRDNGHGIPTELHEKIFQPFVQGFSHETRPQGGVGLGLAIAQKLVAKMNGKIVLESQVGAGSTFTILVPEGKLNVDDLTSLFKPWPEISQPPTHSMEAKKSGSEVVITAPDAREGGAPSHILVVDDERVNREVVWQALREAHEVTRVADGPSALEVMQTKTVDLVLLDIMMPGMSGYDVLDAMRSKGLLEKVPVIVLSAKTSKEAVIKGLELGASDYLGKPFHRAELLCRIRAQLSLKRQRDQLEKEVTAKAAALLVAEHASTVKAQFLSNMSHEIRTPLNGIMGFLELALDSVGSPDQEEYLTGMRERTQTLLTLVNDILDVVRIESKEVNVELAPGIPAEIADRVVSSFAEGAAQKNLKLESSIEDGCREEFLLDSKKLEQILRNLIENSIKFTAQGSIRLDGRKVSVLTDSSVILEFKVSDTGIGVPENQREAIFHPFSQVDSSRTRKFGGLGLGLSICRSFARMLGGDVQVESEPGKGSTFTVTIRASRVRALQAAR